jgi:hypothetical protein
MLVVIADDFSGAAEIGGIGYRYGLNAEIQLKFDSRSTADLIVIDADTRSLTKDEAIEKTGSLVNDLKNSGKRIAFKKVDSVFRGHIVEEINVLQQHFNYRRVLLLPANPKRGRKIISGQYFVNAVSLKQTVFAKDPHFPTTSSSIGDIINKNSSVLRHIHATPISSLPDSALITGDVSSKEDIKSYIRKIGPDDLCCGAAEFFEAFLENNGYKVKKDETSKRTSLQWPYFSLIISGSTVKDQFEKNEIKTYNLQNLSLPGQWSGDQFILEKEKEEKWQAEVSDLLLQYQVVAISVNHEVKQVNGAAEIFSNHFIRLMHYISEKHGRGNIHFALTGGATASAIISKEGITGLKVKKEIAPGIVTLINEQTRELFTVKPGSYLWPASFAKSLINQNKSSE